jgi:hypothetical protein
MTNAALEGNDPNEVRHSAIEKTEQNQMQKEALGREARSVLEQTLVSEYLKTYDAMLWKRFLSTAPEDAETLTLIRHQRGAMERFVKDLTGFVRDGRVAEKELAQTRAALDAAQNRAA